MDDTEETPDEQYNPANDDNQGVVQLMAQGEQDTEGVEQAPQMGVMHKRDQDEGDD